MSFPPDRMRMGREQSNTPGAPYGTLSLSVAVAAHPSLPLGFYPNGSRSIRIVGGFIGGLSASRWAVCAELFSRLKRLT